MPARRATSSSPAAAVISRLRPERTVAQEPPRSTRVGLGDPSTMAAVVTRRDHIHKIDPKTSRVLATIPATGSRAGTAPGAQPRGAKADHRHGQAQSVPLPLAGSPLERDEHHPVARDHLGSAGDILADALLHLRRDGAGAPLSILLHATGTVQLDQPRANRRAALRVRLPFIG